MPESLGKDLGSFNNAPKSDLKALFMAFFVEPTAGLEPATCSLRVSCSTTELRWRNAGFTHSNGTGF